MGKEKEVRIHKLVENGFGPKKYFNLAEVQLVNILFNYLIE